MLHTIRSHARQIVLSVLGSALVVVFAALVWPTPYRYATIHMGDSILPVRISRVTGEAQYLNLYGWQRMWPGRRP